MGVISRYGKNINIINGILLTGAGFQMIGIVTLMGVIIFAGVYYYTNIMIQEDRVYITKQLQTQDILVGSQLILEYKHLTKSDIDYAMSLGYEVVSISNIPQDRSLVVYRRIQ